MTSRTRMVVTAVGRGTFAVGMIALAACFGWLELHGKKVDVVWLLMLVAGAGLVPLASDYIKLARNNQNIPPPNGMSRETTGRFLQCVGLLMAACGLIVG